MTDALITFGATKMALGLGLALIAWIVQVAIKRPQLTHIFWLLVLVTMVTPTLVGVPLLPATTEPATIETMTSVPVSLIDGRTQYAPADPSSIIAGRMRYAPANGSSIIAGRMRYAPGTTLVFVWIGGAVLLVARSLFRVVRFHRALISAAQPAPLQVQELAQGVAARLGLARIPSIYITEATLSPLVWWVGGDIRVVIPGALLQSMTVDQLRWILAHEFAHVVRRDHVVRWLEWSVCVLFWWNPVAWIARRSIRAAEELCCDAMVIAALKPVPRNYAQALMHVVDWMSHSPVVTAPAVAITAVSGGRKTHLHERFTMIVSAGSLTHPARWVTAARRLGVAALLPLGMMGVTTAKAQEVRKVVEAQALSCKSIVAEIKPAIAAGTLTAEQGEALKAVCNSTVTLKAKAPTEKQLQEMKVHLDDKLHERDLDVKMKEREGRVKEALVKAEEANKHNLLKVSPTQKHPIEVEEVLQKARKSGLSEEHVSELQKHVELAKETLRAKEKSAALAEEALARSQEMHLKLGNIAEHNIKVSEKISEKTSRCIEIVRAVRQAVEKKTLTQDQGDLKIAAECAKEP